LVTKINQILDDKFPSIKEANNQANKKFDTNELLLVEIDQAAVKNPLAKERFKLDQNLLRKLFE